MRNLFGAIEARREISLERFIYALGIRHVGETTAVALARGYGNWKDFHEACVKLAKGDAETKEEMDALDQIGDTVIESLHDYFGEAHKMCIRDRFGGLDILFSGRFDHSPHADLTFVPFTLGWPQLSAQYNCSRSLAVKCGT